MPQVDKRSLSERDICTKFITPALVAAGWNIDTQIREEVGFTDGRIYVREQLEQRGVIFAAWNDEIGSAFDPFDLICHIAYEQKPLTRKERAEQVKKRDYFTKYGDLARKVITALLDKYADDGELDLENPEIIRLDPLNCLTSPLEIIRAFGGKGAYDAAIHALTDELYKTAA